MAQHTQNDQDESDLFHRYRSAIAYGNDKIWDEDSVFPKIEIPFPMTKAGKMPKRARVMGCWCYGGWHSRLDMSHQWATEHLSAQYKVEVEVLRTIRILPFSLGGIRSWNRELTPEQWKRTIPGGKPTLIFLTNYALAVHFALKLGVLVGDIMYDVRNKMYKDMVSQPQSYEEPDANIRDWRGLCIDAYGERASKGAIVNEQFGSVPKGDSNA